MMASTGYDSTGDVIRHDIGQLRGLSNAAEVSPGGQLFLFWGGGTDGVTDHICKLKDRRLSITGRWL